MKRIALAIACGTYLFISTSCGNLTPTAPSPILDLPSAQTTAESLPESAAEIPKAEPPPPTGFEGHISLPSGGKIRAWARNVTDEDRKVHFVCYENPTGDIEDQTLMEPYQTSVVTPGDEVRFKVEELPCRWQCDLVTGMAEPKKGKPHYRPDQLIAFAEGGEGICEPPPPPPRCVEKECPGANWKFDPASCQCIWICNSISEPECEEQVWDPTTCMWVGVCL